MHLLNCAACLEMELELDLAHVVSIWLSANLSLDVVGPENGLFDFHIRKSNKWGTERLHRIRGLLAIEDHSVGGEINPATLGALENGIVLTGELHGDTVAVEQYAESVKAVNLCAIFVSYRWNIG